MMFKSLFIVLVFSCTVWATKYSADHNNEVTGHNPGQRSEKWDPAIFDVLDADYFDDPPTIDGDTRSDDENEKEGVDEPEVVTRKAFCVGCPMEANTEDNKIKDIASFAFVQHYSLPSAHSHLPENRARTLIRVVKAETQVVAGLKYILEVEGGVSNCSHEEALHKRAECALDPSHGVFKCNFQVLEQAWLERKELLHSECHDANTINPDLKSDRRRRDLGKAQEVENEDERLKDMAQFALEQLDRIDEDNEARVLVQVLTAKKQTVSGWLYTLKIRAASTTCAEDSGATMEKCKDKIILPYSVCNVKVLFQPWQTVQKKVTESQCFPEKRKSKKLIQGLGTEVDNQTKKRKLIGGYSPVDPESKDLLSLADFVVESLDAESNALHTQKLVRVVQAFRQVVNGVNTKLIMELGYTNCRKSIKLDRSTCELDDARDHQVCRVSIWEQPWLQTKKITGTKCTERKTNDPERPKRDLSVLPMNDEEEHLKKKFEEFKRKHEKHYESEAEHVHRFQIFKGNMKKVKLLQQYEQGTATYGATEFADLTEKEFEAYLGLRPDLRRHPLKKKAAKIPTHVRVPEDFDWRHYNAVTPIKNQGLCGSCWAFSVTGNIEGGYAIKYGDLVSFSEQELVDCDTLDEGCNGGLPENAYKILERIGGLEEESAYPYDGKNEKCHFDETKVKAKVKSYVQLPKNETEIAAYLFKHGPLSIGINANAMQFYFGGVSHPWKFLCGSKSLDHGVLIVGFGVETTYYRHKRVPYWIIKNSWGTSWGEKGYYRIYRGDNVCGVAEMVTSAQVA